MQVEAVLAGEDKATKELFPIVLAVAVWGQAWSHKHLTIHCDNMAVWMSQSSLPILRFERVLIGCLHFLSSIG